MKLILLSAISMSFLSMHVIGATANNNSVNLHNKDIAETQYEAFKNGNSIDPLEEVRSGYRQAYSDDLQNGILEDKMLMEIDLLSMENERLTGFIEGLSESKSIEKRNIYESALNEDGTLDYEAFAASYSDYLSDNRDLVSDTIGDRNSFSQDVIERTSESALSAGEDHTSNAYTAAGNIIDIINTDRVEYTSSVTERLNEALNQTRQRVPVGAEALELAYIFDGECGDTCEFPPDIDDETERDCLYDDNNYIFESKSDHSEYGIWEEEREEIDYMFKDTRVYSYSADSTNRSGEWVSDVQESGSTDGYSMGSLVSTEYSGSNYGAMEWSYYEICVD